MTNSERVNLILFSTVQRLSQELALCLNQEPEVVVANFMLAASLTMHELGDEKLEKDLSMYFPQLYQLLLDKKALPGT